MINLTASYIAIEEFNHVIKITYLHEVVVLMHRLFDAIRGESEGESVKVKTIEIRLLCDRQTTRRKKVGGWRHSF